MPIIKEPLSEEKSKAADMCMKDGNHATKVRIMAPLLFGEAFQPLYWIRYLQEVDILPSIELSEHSFPASGMFHKLLVCVQVLERSEEVMRRNMTHKRCKEQVREMFDKVNPSILHDDKFPPGPLDKLLDLAKEFEFLHRWQKHIKSKIEERVLRQNLRHSFSDRQIVVAMLFCARQYLIDGMHEDVMEDFMDACERQRKSILQEKDLGNEKFNNSDYHGAIEVYSKAINKSPFWAVLYSNRAQSYLKLKDSKSALWDSVRALILSPDWEKTYYRYAQACITLSWLPLARSFLLDAVAKFPQNKELNEQLREIYPSLEEDVPDLTSSDDDEEYISRRELQRKSAIRALLQKKSEEMEKSKATEKSVKKCVRKSESDSQETVQPGPQTKENTSTNSISKPKDTTSQMLHSLLLGSYALDSGQYSQAQQHYSEAAALISKHTLKFFNPSFKEIDLMVLKYSVGTVHVHLGTYHDITNALRQFQDIVDMYKHVQFPLAYLGLCEACYMLNRFSDVREAAGSGLCKLDSMNRVHEYWLPGTCSRGGSGIRPEPIVIEESRKDKMRARLQELLTLASNPPLPDAICKFANCQQSHFKIQIYFSDPDYKGLVRVRCRAKCCIEYHIECWRKFKKDKVTVSDKDILNGACLTPDCNEPVYIIQLHDENGETSKELKSSSCVEEKVPTRPIKSKQAKQQKSSCTAIAKKEERKNQRKQRREEEKALKTLQKSASMSAIDLEVKVEPKESNQVMAKSEDSAAPVNTSNMTVLKKEEEVEVATVEVKAKSKSKKKNRPNKTPVTMAFVTAGPPRENLQSAETADPSPYSIGLDGSRVMNSGHNAWTFDHQNPFTVPIAIEAEVKAVDAPMFHHHPAAMEIISVFENLLIENGPMSVTDPVVRKVLEDLPTECQDILTHYEHIGVFLALDPLFTLIGKTVTLRDQFVVKNSGARKSASRYKAQLDEFLAPAVTKTVDNIQKKTSAHKNSAQVKQEPITNGIKHPHKSTASSNSSQSAVSNNSHSTTSNKGNGSKLQANDTSFDLETYLMSGKAQPNVVTSSTLTSSNGLEDLFGPPPATHDTPHDQALLEDLFVVNVDSRSSRNSVDKRFSLKDSQPTFNGSTSNSVSNDLFFQQIYSKSDDVISVKSEASSKTEGGRDFLRGLFLESSNGSPLSLQNSHSYKTPFSPVEPPESVSSYSYNAYEEPSHNLDRSSCRIRRDSQDSSFSLSSAGNIDSGPQTCGEIVQWDNSNSPHKAGNGDSLEADWANLVNCTSTAEQMMHEEKLPSKRWEPSRMASSHAENALYTNIDSNTGTRFGPIGSRSSQPANLTGPPPSEPINTFPGAYDDPYSMFPSAVAKVAPHLQAGYPSYNTPYPVYGSVHGLGGLNPSEHLNAIWGVPVDMGGGYGDDLFPSQMDTWQDYNVRRESLDEEPGTSQVASKVSKEADLDTFVEVSRLWNEAEMQRDEARRQLTLKEQDLVQKERQCSDLQYQQSQLVHDINTLQNTLQVERHLNEKFKKDVNVLELSARENKARSEKAEMELIRVHQEAECFKLDHMAAMMEQQLEAAAILKRNSKDNWTVENEMFVNHELRAMLGELKRAKTEFLANLNNLKEILSKGGVLQYPLPAPDLSKFRPPNRNVMAPFPMPGQGFPPNFRFPIPHPGMQFRPMRVQGGAFPGPRGAVGAPGALRVEPKKHQFEALVDRLQQMFPEHHKTDIIKVIQDIRTRHSNTLNGVPLTEIISLAAECLTEKKQAAWEPLPQRSVYQPNTELFEEEENSCIICFESMQTIQMSVLDCGHRFHKECIRQWFNEQSTCPNCRCHSLLPDEFPALK